MLKHRDPEVIATYWSRKNGTYLPKILAQVIRNFVHDKTGWEEVKIITYIFSSFFCQNP